MIFFSRPSQHGIRTNAGLIGLIAQQLDYLKKLDTDKPQLRDAVKLSNIIGAISGILGRNIEGILAKNNTSILKAELDRVSDCFTKEFLSLVFNSTQVARDVHDNMTNLQNTVDIHYVNMCLYEEPRDSTCLVM